MHLGITQFSYGGVWEEFITAAASTGTSDVEFFVYEADVPALLGNAERAGQLRAAAARAGVRVRSLCVTTFSKAPRLDDADHAIRALAEARLAASLRTAHDLGAAVVLVPGAPSLEDEAAVDRFVAAMRTGAARARDLSLKIGWEQGLTTRGFLELLTRIDSDAVGDYLDFGNVVGRGGDLPDEIRERAGHIVQVHAKGVHGAALDAGTLDLAGAMAALRETNYDAYVMLETRRDEADALGAMQRNYRLLVQAAGYV